MFILAGISPRIKILDPNPRSCPACGSAQAYLKRVDHYFNLFFIPVFRVKKNEPFILCDRCEKTLNDSGQPYCLGLNKPDITCKSCGRLVEKTFRYCPDCGQPV